MKRSMKELILFVREWAQAHYSQHGWDQVVEVWSDEDLQEIIGNAHTLGGALRKVSYQCGLIKDREDDVRAEVF